MKTFVIGDIHGRHKALKEVLKKSKFNYKEDKLIVLGDIVDGGINTYEVVEELMKIDKLIFVRGNHDNWFMKHISKGFRDEVWLQQGGANTLRSYGAKVILPNYITDETLIDTSELFIPVTHQEFFNKSVYYYVEDNMLFVHGGLNPKIPKLNSQSSFELMWNRYVIDYAKKHKVQEWDKVFIGHTTTQTQNSYEPVKYNNLIMMDTGAGWNGKLTIMNITTEEYWQSKKQTPCI